MKTLVSWSSGKDSAWMVHTLRQRGDVEIGALLTTINEPAQRVAMHAVRVDVLKAQAESLGFPLWLVPIPSPCPNEVYEEAMRTVVARAVRNRHHRRARRICLHGLMHYPQRIVCLTEETTETLYLLGQGDRIVGVSGYTVRPPEARLKPKVSAFINAKFDKIEDLKPDLVLAFSDLQADLVKELVRRGMNVVVFNQRSVAEILQMIAMLGGLVGCQREGERLADRLATDLNRIRESASAFAERP